MHCLRELLAPGSGLSIIHAADGRGQVMPKLTPPCEEAGITYQPRPHQAIGGWPQHASDRSGAYAAIAIMPSAT
ncbi:hypothetical protein ACIO6T_18780 [Streptomyces sp. NPDC087532]|uniref:hypothetical protein n=1 Tax=Streptomyces sp. NPDC087532 TaxID=3365795 RepID=UPI003812FA86